MPPTTLLSAGLAEWSTFAQAVFSGLSLISILFVWYQLKETTHQFRQTTKWNKIQGQFQFVNMSDPRLEAILTDNLERVIGSAFHRLSEPLSSEQAEIIWKDDAATMATKTFLNAFEQLGAAYRIGFVDHDLAFSLQANRVIRAKRFLWPFISLARKELRDPEIFLELERLSNTFQDIESQRDLEREKKRIEAAEKERDGDGRGVPKAKI